MGNSNVLFHLRGYWTLWSVFYSIILQLSNFLFFPKIPCTLFKNLRRPTIQPLFEIKTFWPTTRLFTKSSSFWKTLCMPWHTNQLAPKKIKWSSDDDRMTAEFYKNVYQRTYLPNNFRLRILRNKKVLEKSHIGWRQMLVPRLFSRINSSQKFRRCRFQSFLFLSSFSYFLYLYPNILSRIVDVYYSLEGLGLQQT